MRDFVESVVVWSRAILAMVLAAILFALIYMNWGQSANVWLWRQMEVPTLWLVVVTAVSALLMLWGGLRLRRVIGDVKRLRAKQRARRQVEDGADGHPLRPGDKLRRPGQRGD